MMPKRKNYSNPISNCGPSPYRKSQRMSMVNEDRISSLDDKLLLHVLSFLPTLDAIRTCVLSKRWTWLWTCIPCLSFSLERTPCKTVDQFISFVENTLILNRSSKIVKFHLHFLEHWRDSQVKLDSKVIDIWIRFATRADVEELSLGLYEDFNVPWYTLEEKLTCNYQLPRHVFACSSLTKLYLSRCNIVPHGVISWTLLKSLSFKTMELSDDLMRKVFSGSPILEVLVISQCGGLNRLDITSTSLRKLVIEDYCLLEKPYTSFVYTTFEISAPNILALEILGYFGKKCRLVDVSSLVSVHVGFELDRLPICDHTSIIKYYKESQNMLRELLSALQRIKELTFGLWCLQIVTTLLKVKSLHSPLSECKSLTLKAVIEEEGEPLGMAKLLQSLPHLEKLTIDPSDCECYDLLQNWKEERKMLHNSLDKRKISWISKEKIFNSLVLHDLKTVRIFASYRCIEKQIILLAELLLKNATVLETMVFKVSTVGYCMNWRPQYCFHYEREGLLKIAQKLLSFPRSSPNANIQFLW